MKKTVEGEGGKIKSFFKRNWISTIFLVSLVFIVGVITYYRVLIQIEMGGISDSFDFLSNALVFAGQSMGYSDLLRPPFFPFLISIIFRFGYISTNIIFVLDGLIFIFGVIGLFLLLKIRFNDLESFLGAMLYATFPIVLTVLGVGFSDLVSASLSIWAILFLVLAFKRDPKFFYLAFPFLMFAFLSRYNTALLIFPIFLYLLFNRNKINFKHLFGGLVASFLLIVPVLVFFYEKFGNIIYPFLNFNSVSTTTAVSSESAAYYPNVLFFVQKFPDLVGPQGFIIILIILMGILVFLIPKFIQKIRKNRNSKGFYGLNRYSQLKLTALIIIVGAFILSFGKISYYINEILFFISAYLCYDLLKKFDLKYLDVDILVLAWFMAFFIFHSIFVIKDNRYFVLMAPPVAYLLILGLSSVTNRIKLKINERNMTLPALAVLLVVVMLLSTASQIPSILEANNDKVITNQDMVMASQWLMGYDPDYKSKNIYSDLWPNFSWYLKTDVKPVPVFKDNQTFSNGIKNSTFNQEDSKAFNNYLVSNNAYYYISVRQGLNLTSYTPIKVYGNVTIYQTI